MAVRREGTPCWADVTFTDVEAAKRFYGDVLGWTFGESSSEYGNYTQAHADGKAVAAVVPPMPGQEDRSARCLHLAAEDAAATAARIREHGGEVIREPMRVGGFGTMCLAREPGGALFGVWQAGSHEGFEATGVPGAYAWAEVFTREPRKTDSFLSAVYGYRQRRPEEQGDVGDVGDGFRLYDLGGRPVLGRMAMGDDFPPEVASYVNVYFTVPDCDEAVATATGLGGLLRFGPMGTPFGRFAALTDPQGANFSVIDVTTAEGGTPQTRAVS
ncbi:VOC family protein [Streptomyces sp. NPDC006622]|uniref:VOC family protein n=1 Tax=Streptomyces sp. NPDC006622 TaxID=3155459 RepID=UPI00339E3DDF